MDRCHGPPFEPGRAHLRLVVWWHALDGLLVDGDGLLERTLVRVQPAEVEERRDLGGLVRARVLEAGAVQGGAVAVDGGGRLPLPRQAQHQTFVQVRHCRRQGSVSRRRRTVSVPQHAETHTEEII